MNDAAPLTHRQTWELIPWVVNDTATPDERAQVETHLRDCADCRDEYALQVQFHAGINTPAEIAHDPQPVLQRLLARIDADEQPAVSVAPQRQRWMQWLAAAVVAQAVGLALLGGVILSRHDGYATLSRGDAVRSEASIRFVPAPALTLAAMQKLLAENGLRIVESNTGNAIFGLALAEGTDAASVDAIVAKLRQQPGVLLAEPVAGKAHAPH